ncbi:MAG: hypothetical protein V4578_10780 [Pseudomonadota bacterium]
MNYAAIPIAASLLVAAASAAAGSGGHPTAPGFAVPVRSTLAPPVPPPAPAAANRHAPATPAGPTHTGQPNQSCGSVTAPTTPGRSMDAPGSAFNPDGTAGTVYAGEQPQNSKNPVSVSQYDVACARQPSR